MINCKHKPIKSQISISKDLYDLIFEDKNINTPINIIYFKYFQDDKVELIYVSPQYCFRYNIINNQTLTLFDIDGNENLMVVNFFDGIIKMCKECFFEYTDKYN